MGRWGRSIPSSPDSWECDETGAKDNLWLNLSTGFIGSGRQVAETSQELQKPCYPFGGQRRTFALPMFPWGCCPSAFQHVDNAEENHIAVTSNRSLLSFTSHLAV